MNTFLNYSWNDKTYDQGFKRTMTKTRKYVNMDGQLVTMSTTYNLSGDDPSSKQFKAHESRFLSGYLFPYYHFYQLVYYFYLLVPIFVIIMIIIIDWKQIKLNSKLSHKDVNYFVNILNTFGCDLMFQFLIPPLCGLQ